MNKVLGPSGRVCPRCRGCKIRRCRCLNADSSCETCGYEWHTCPVHQLLIEGPSDHSGSGCQCPPEPHDFFLDPDPR